MIDFDYINSLIGIPYEDNGRSLDGMDCYGLVLLVSQTQFDNTLPDWVTDHTARDVVRQITQGIGTALSAQQACKVEHPTDGDIAVVARKELPYHMGVVMAGGVLHMSLHAGVTFEPIGHFIATQGPTEFYKWQP